MADTNPFYPGLVIGERYELIEAIGLGSFGTIYRARQRGTDRDVAIKLLPPRFSATERIATRFRREAQLASRLRHPNTITIHDYGYQDDFSYIVMEYLDGHDLADRLSARSSLPLASAVSIGHQCLQSLAEAHEQGIIHRDLKPENIFLTTVAGRPDVVKILDFGIAKLASPDMEEQVTDSGRQLTIQGSTVGTPIYMSPEQAAGEDLTPASDIYSLGVLLFEMVNGHPPFKGDRPTRTMRAHINDPIPEFSNSLLRGSHFEALVRSILAKDPEQRPGPAQALAIRLNAPLDNLTAPLEDNSRIPFDTLGSRASQRHPSSSSSILTVTQEPDDSEIIVLAEQKASACSDGDSDGEEWEWGEDVAPADASGSQILYQSQRQSSGQPLLLFGGALLVLITIGLALYLQGVLT